MTSYSQRIEGLSASLLSNLVRIIVITIGILMILQSIGISVTPILATLGIGGLAVGLAFQDTLSNLFSGLYLIISRQVRKSFEEFKIEFIVFLRVIEFLDQRLVKHEFIKRLHKRYREEGIEIPLPSRTVYLKQNFNETPPNLLGKGGFPVDGIPEILSRVRQP